MKTSEIVQAAVKKQAKNLDKVDRIYDSLAKVLVPGSECVAAASIDGILYVAENEVNTDGNKKGVPESLDALKKYILDKFLTKKDKDNRDGLENLAKKICTKEKIKFCFKQNASTYTTNLHTQAENIVFVEKSQTIYYPNLKKNPQIGYNAPMVTFGAVEMMQNVENLKKVKQYCQTNGYEISVSLELPKDHNDVDVRTIYLSNTGEYIVKDQLNENTFHKGKLDMININHQNLINLTISNSDKYNIFQQVSEAGHIYHQMPNDSFSKQIYETMWVYNPLEKKGKKLKRQRNL